MSSLRIAIVAAVIAAVIAAAVIAAVIAAVWPSDAPLRFDAPLDTSPAVEDHDVYVVALSVRATNLRAGHPPDGIPDPLTVVEA